MSSWNSPDLNPPKPGEYRVALEPAEASPRARRGWDGQSWSSPYIDNWPDALKEKARLEVSPQRPYWQPL